MKPLAIAVLCAMSMLSSKAYSERIVSIAGQELEQAIHRITFSGDTAILHLIDGSTLNTNCLLLEIEFKTESGLSDLQNSRVLLARNPVSDHLQLENLEAGSMLLLYDAKGSIIKKQQARSSSDHMDLSGLPGGVYLLRAGKYIIRFIKQ